ncbi:hypothetical protein F5Y12DRAFT_790487 [Xylaria sp. FL1777]|nr:hypothetical protein F5Y12DRAFT_790487 [Xylaria sp. FL1777]
MKPFITAILAVLAVGPCALAQSFLTNCTWQTAMLVDSYLGAYCNNDNWEIYSYDWTCGGQLAPYNKFVHSPLYSAAIIGTNRVLQRRLLAQLQGLHNSG